MKTAKILVSIALTFLIGISSYAQSNSVPNTFWQQNWKVGDDLMNGTLENCFLNQQFISTNNPDSSINWVRYGDISKKDDVVRLVIEVMRDKKRISTLSFLFRQEDGFVQFYHGESEIFQTGQTDAREDVSSLQQYYILFRQLAGLKIGY